jgi:hypothetical protein
MRPKLIRIAQVLVLVFVICPTPKLVEELMVGKFPRTRIIVP